MHFCLRRGAILCVLALVALGGALLALAAGGPPTPSAATKPTTATASCVTDACHVAIVNRKVLHGPVAQKKCLDCHKYEDAGQHRFKRLPAPDQGCTACHDLKHKATVHQPVREGRCTLCHDPHGSDYPKSLRADPGRALCLLCHKQDDVTKKKTFVHTPVAVGQCSACHEPHSSAQPKLVKQSTPALCTTNCHKDLVTKLVDARSVHPPARDDCLVCHDAHAANLPHQLKQAAPALCLSCHKNLKDALAKGPVVHGAATQDGGCSVCHLPHASKLPQLQRQPQPELCLSCHDRPVRTADGRTLTNMAALLKDNPDHHGPIRLGSCTACHQPHAGNQVNLLVAAYPPEFYAPFDLDRYQLCFTCHSPELVLQKGPTAPTGFTDGKQNLHWLHVNQEKGRTCRACHEVHASTHPFHIRDAVPFGPNGWMMEIKYQETPRGGSCSPGCHVPRSYDHGDRPRAIPPEALLPKARDLVNPPPPPTPTTAPAVRAEFPVPTPPFSPGIFPCTRCHDPALAVNTERRVLQKAHGDIQLHHDEAHRWCLDCHNADNRDVLRSAAGAPIPFAESYRLCGQCHGPQYRDWKEGVHGKRTGEWDGRKDYLLCVNCHNPHSPRFKPLEPLPPPVRRGS